MTTITLTDRASRRVRQLLDGVDSETRFGLRVGVESHGWAQRYQLSLAPAPEVDELVVRLNDVDVFVRNAAVALIDGVRIDYVETSSAAGFTFHNPGAVGSGARAAGSGARAAGSGQLPAGADRLDGGRPEGVDEQLWHRIEAAMDDVRPYLLRDGGDAGVVDFSGGTLWIELVGACSGCSAAQSTLVNVIEQQITAAVPEITKVAVVS